MRAVEVLHDKKIEDDLIWLMSVGMVVELLVLRVLRVLYNK